jgi:hypothetical protein
MLGLAYLMPDCWLEVSLHPEGPATGQLDQDVSVVFLCPRANAELVPKFHVALHATHAALPMITLKFRPNVALLMSDFQAWTRPQDLQNRLTGRQS